MNPALPHPVLLPERNSLCGPVTLRHIVRFLLIYLGAAVAGLDIALVADSPQWQAFGLGLILPGGGFLAHADLSSGQGLWHAGLTVLGILTFGIGVFIWFATGNAIAPPLIWLLFAFAAMGMDHGHVHGQAVWSAVLIVAAMTGMILFYAVIRRIMGVRKRREANAYLSHAGWVPEPAETSEFSLHEMKLMRFLCDRALQPLDQFNGFEWLDQFQTAAVRYQLNFCGYALSMAQFTKLPGFQGYLSEAQKRLILKQTDKRVWGYWKLENAWGNLKLNADPTARENIMFTGFCATQMMMYHAASGHRDFEGEGSFQLGPFSSSLPHLHSALRTEMDACAFQLIACEPNWVYPLCNLIGASALQESQEVWEKYKPDFQDKLESEFMDLEGRFIPCRSRYTGFALPVFGGIMPQALPCFFMNATFPDLAMRQWLLVRREIVGRKGELLRDKFWKIDTGNYKFSRAAAYASTALAAAEMGDGEVKQLCLTALDEECPVYTESGHYYRPKASVWAHAVEFLARSTEQNSFKRLAHSGGIKKSNPYLDNTSYSDFMVAAASSENNSLRLVLYPETDTSEGMIEIAGLETGKAYACSAGPGMVADINGRAAVKVRLAGRTEITIYQVP